MQTDADNKDYYLAKEDSSESLLRFLKDVEPLISKALNRNTQSTAFEGESLFFIVSRIPWVANLKMSRTFSHASTCK